MLLTSGNFLMPKVRLFLLVAFGFVLPHFLDHIILVCHACILLVEVQGVRGGGGGPGLARTGLLRVRGVQGLSQRPSVCQEGSTERSRNFLFAPLTLSDSIGGARVVGAFW